MATKVKLRQKAITGDKQSLYLDFYPPILNPNTGKTTRRDFLGLFLYNEIEHREEKYIANNKPQIRIIPVLDKKGKPKKVSLSPVEKQHNKECMQLAEQIRQKRDKQLNGNDALNDLERKMVEKDRIETEKGGKSFTEYFQKLVDKRKGTNYDNWTSCMNYLKKFKSEGIKFSELNEMFCEEFKEFLLTTPSIKSDKTTLSQNSVVSYFNKLKAALKQAYKDGILNDNLNSKVEAVESEEIVKTTLTLEELNVLANTEYPNKLLVKSGLFMALTGLPFKEMQNLIWEQIGESETFGIVISMIRQKTGKPYYVNISQQAYQLLGERKNNKDKVFENLSNRERYYDFHQWLQKAGIEKDITFHDLRHTYGTLQIDLGTDLYTLKSNMNHGAIRTTMQYGKVSDNRKREAAEKIKLDIKIN